MKLINRILQLYFAPRLRKIEYFKSHPQEVQQEQYARLVRAGAKTAFGREHGIYGGMPYSEFRKRVPIMEYRDMAPYVERIRGGEHGVTWNTPVGWLCKSSGTTEGASKYIPLTKQGLRDSHMRGPLDLAALYTHLYPNGGAYLGKTLILGGSKKLEKKGDKIPSGDLSSILIDNTPSLGNLIREPHKSIALIADFDKKVRLICEKVTKKDVRALAGVPSWNLVMIERILQYTGKQNLLEVWGNMELFVHGGMSFKPYKRQFEKLIPTANMKYIETYNASEGFFGIAEEPYTDEMLLMLDYNCFYEFMPTDAMGDKSKVVPLEGVEVGKNYALLITSSNGLWRYMIGDTVCFTQTTPYKFRFTGRTKLFVNAFGEEIIIDNAEKAMEQACNECGAEIKEFTMAPVFMGEIEGEMAKGTHEWVVAFYKQPDTLEHFTDALDRAMQAQNSDYAAKRKNNFTLLCPIVTVVAENTFEELLRSEGRLGGQIKIPRLNPTRDYVEQLKQLHNKISKQQN